MKIKQAMEEEVLQTVLTEVLQELKEVKQQQVHSITALGEIKETLLAINKSEGVKQELASKGVTSVSTMIEEGLHKIEAKIEQRSTSITRQFRVLLFPEHGAREYYKLVFGRVLFWMVIVLIATYLFVIGKAFIEAYNLVQFNEIERSKYQRAWIDFYRNSKRAVKLKMDSVWRKS